MHHLHPRSRSTSTLFTTTLAVSFLVVAAPHLLPCPVDRRQFADSFETPDGKRYRRKRKEATEPASPAPAVDDVTCDAGCEDTLSGEKPKRECPVPKPRGLVGQLMGFKPEDRRQTTEVVIQPLDSKKTRQMPKQGDEHAG